MAYNTFNPIVYKGLVLYLDAENLKSYSGSGLNWYDLTSNGNNGVLTNGATFSLSGNSIQFDGVNDYVNIPYSPVFNIQRFTLSVWVRFSSFESFNSLVTNPQTGTGVDISGGSWFNPYLSWMLRVNSNNEIEVGMGSNSTYYNSNFSYTFTTNEVYNIVVTYDESTVIVYVNSVKIGQNSVSTTINYTSKPVIIGTDYGGGFSNCFIYNTQVYNRDLTPAEILQNYNATKWRFINELPSIVTDQLYLNLDAGDILSYPGSGTTWYDLTVNSHNATLTNGAYYDPSDSGVMIFDGINDYANVGSLGSGFGIFTLDMWFNSSSVTDYKNIIDFNGLNESVLRIEQYTSPGYQFNWLNIGSNTRARMGISFNVGDSFGFGGDGPGVITDNTWYNLVVTFDGTYCSIYINNQKLVNNYLVTGGFVGYINNMRIGDGYDYSSRRFQGKIPVVRIYKKALSDSEVLQNYNVQKSRYGL